MQIFSVAEHEPSFLPEGNWQIVWNDEFDGSTLDNTKWDYRTCMMGKRHPAWVEDGVHLDGRSNAVFTLILKDGKPVSSQLQTGHNFMDQPVAATTFGDGTFCDHLQWPIGKLFENKFTHGYGYYECRCRLQQKPGWWTAFWIQSPVIGSSLDPKESGVEIDIMESFEPGRVHRHQLFTGGYGLDMQASRVGNGVTLDKGEFHRFGLLWDETGYTFYVDGIADAKCTEKLTGRPEFILISTEVQGYRHAGHQPVEEAYDSVGDTFLVDYVRVFDKVI